MNQDASTNEPRRPARSAPVKRVGVVDSISGHKTVRILLTNLVKHRLYGKYLRRRTRLMVHDDELQAGVGDTVEVVQCRPISKRKSWRLVRVVKRAAGVEAADRAPGGGPSARGAGDPSDPARTRQLREIAGRGCCDGIPEASRRSLRRRAKPPLGGHRNGR